MFGKQRSSDRLISVGVSRTLLRVAFSFGFLGRTRGYRVQRVKAVPLMREKNPQGHNSERRSRCEIDHCQGSTFCMESAKVELNGLMLCEKHTLEAKLEGQITCWEAMLAHLDLWSREAIRRDRPEIAGLLEVERLEAVTAIEQASRD